MAISKVAATVLYATLCSYAQGLPQNQTLDFSPLLNQDEVPFRVHIEEVNLPGKIAIGLQSAAHSIEGEQFLLIGGRSAGMHNFACPEDSFPPEEFSSWIYVFASKTMTWSFRSLLPESTGLTPEQIAELSAINALYEQRDGKLVIAGGYGINAAGEYVTFKHLKVLDLEGIFGWIDDDGSVLADHIHFLEPPANTPEELSEDFFQLTGGTLIRSGMEFWMCLGQTFTGGYTVGCTDPDVPQPDQVYSRGYRSFTIDLDSNPPVATYVFHTTNEPPIAEEEPGYNPYQDWARRRDLNIFQARVPDNQLGAVALGGVFLAEPYNGIWTVPIVFNENGSMTMDDPETNLQALKQGFNVYHSGLMALWSESRQENWFLTLGGLGYHVLSDGELTVAPNIDYSNDAMTVRYVPETNEWSQHLMDAPYPYLADIDGNQFYFGTETIVIPLVDLDQHQMYDLDSITSSTPVAALYGGIASRGQTGRDGTFASDKLFTVHITPACEADLNYDGFVNSFDLSFMLVAWGPVPRGQNQPADLNDDGVVNGIDLGILLYDWGTCRM